ncbi:MAG: hypothetical protein SCM11_13710 [Bacillota bacterium]|nr:hypothetical protein [Bacillota bacterium]
MIILKGIPIKFNSRRPGKITRQILILGLLMLSFLLVASGCTGSRPAVEFKPGEKFTIGVGESAEIIDEDLIITFVKVIGDSRCPKDAVCIWSGVVSFQVNITYRGASYQLALNQPGLTDQAEYRFFNYDLTFRIDPYPSASEPVESKDYQLTMTVGK